MQWIKDPVVEKQLVDLDAEWKYRPSVQISTLQVGASLKNNARFGKPINDDTVLAYAFQLAEGAPFPAIVVSPQGLILAGNHRVAAVEMADGKTIAAYVITNGTKAMYDQFIRTDNTRHGEKLTEEQAIQQCIHLHKEYKIPFTELNKRFFGNNSRTHTKLTNAWRAHLVSEILNDEGIDADRLTPGAKSKLYMLAPSEGGGIQNIKLLSRMARLFIKERFKDVEVNEVVAAVKKSPDEKTAMAAVKAHVANRIKPQRSTANPLRQRFLIGVSSLRNFMETGINGAKLTSLGQLDLSEEQAKEAIQTFTKLSAQMADLKRQYKKGKK